MYKLFYTITALFFIAWVVFLVVGYMGNWVHAFLAGAVVSMTIGLFMRSAKS